VETIVRPSVISVVAPVLPELYCKGLVQLKKAAGEDLTNNYLAGSGPLISVADRGCLSRIRLFSIPEPGSEFFLSRIPDLHQRI